MKTKLTAQDWALCLTRKVAYCNKTYEIIDYTSTCLILSLDNGYPVSMDSCKPILRTLAQITEEEKQEYVNLFGDPKPNSFCYDDAESGIPNSIIGDCGDFGQFYVCSPLIHDWLTQKGFDIRNWIEQGLAVKEEQND